MAGIWAGVGTIDYGSLFGVRGIVFLINGNHFCLFQNTIFELNSGVPVRTPGNQSFTKNRE